MQHPALTDLIRFLDRTSTLPATRGAKRRPALKWVRRDNPEDRTEALSEPWLPADFREMGGTIGLPDILGGAMGAELEMPLKWPKTGLPMDPLQSTKPPSIGWLQLGAEVPEGAVRKLKGDRQLLALHHGESGEATWFLHRRHLKAPVVLLGERADEVVRLFALGLADWLYGEHDTKTIGKQARQRKMRGPALHAALAALDRLEESLEAAGARFPALISPEHTRRPASSIKRSVFVFHPDDMPKGSKAGGKSKSAVLERAAFVLMRGSLPKELDAALEQLDEGLACSDRDMTKANKIAMAVWKKDVGAGDWAKGTGRTIDYGFYPGTSTDSLAQLFRAHGVHAELAVPGLGAPRIGYADGVAWVRARIETIRGHLKKSEQLTAPAPVPRSVAEVMPGPDLPAPTVAGLTVPAVALRWEAPLETSLWDYEHLLASSERPDPFTSKTGARVRRLPVLTLPSELLPDSVPEAGLSVTLDPEGGHYHEETVFIVKPLEERPEAAAYDSYARGFRPICGEPFSEPETLEEADDALRRWCIGSKVGGTPHPAGRQKGMRGTWNYLFQFGSDLLGVWPFFFDKRSSEINDKRPAAMVAVYRNPDTGKYRAQYSNWKVR